MFGLQSERSERKRESTAEALRRVDKLMDNVSERNEVSDNANRDRQLAGANRDRQLAGFAFSY